MNNPHVVMLVAMTLCVIGCSSQHNQNQITTIKSRAILEALNARDRDSVSVALRTLHDNGVRNLPSVNLRAHFYSEIQPAIKRISNLVKALPDEKLNALDESLAQHWRFYSRQYFLPDDWPDIWDTMIQTAEPYTNRWIEALTRSSQQPAAP